MYQLFIDTKGKSYDNKTNIDCLSMGMSGDFEDAIAEGPPRSVWEPRCSAPGPRCGPTDDRGPRPQLLEILLEEDTLLMSFMDELRRLARPMRTMTISWTKTWKNRFAEPREDRKARRKREDRDDDLDTGYTSVNNDKVVNINTTTQLQVVLVKPEKFQDASTIADHLGDKRTVVLEPGIHQ